MKKLIAILVVLAGIVVGLTYAFQRESQAKTLPPRLGQVDRGDVTEKVSGTGKLVPMDLTYVSTEVPAARVVEVLPASAIGSRVEKGQPLLRLDDELAKARLDEAESAVLAAQSLKLQAEAKKRTAEAGVGQAKAQHVLAQKIYDQKYSKRDDIPKGDLDAAEKAVTAAQEAVNMAEAQVKEAESAIMSAEANIKKAKAGVTAATLARDMTVVTAPIAGVILDRRVVQGQVISPQTNPVLFVMVPELHKFELIAQIGEADITKVTKNMTARFTVDAYGEDDTKFTGNVTNIAFLPTQAPTRALEAATGAAGPVLYGVTIKVLPWKDQDAKPLKPGLTANVDLIVNEVEKALRVPSAALNYRPVMTDDERKLIEQRDASGWKPLWVWKDEAPVRMFVKTGASDGNKTQITEVDGELPEHAEVILENAPPAEGGGLFSRGQIKIF